MGAREGCPEVGEGARGVRALMAYGDSHRVYYAEAMPHATFAGSDRTGVGGLLERVASVVPVHPTS